MAHQPHDTLLIFLISYHGTPNLCPLGPSKKHYINFLNLSTKFNKYYQSMVILNNTCDMINIVVNREVSSGPLKNLP